MLHQSLQSIIGGDSLGDQSSDIVKLFVKSQFSTSERRCKRSDLISDLKKKLEVITGRVLEIKLENIVLQDDKMLGYYSPQDYQTLTVTVAKDINYDDVNQVEKLEMADEEYDKRKDSVREFKRRHKLGRFAEKEESYDFNLEASSINVGDRCVVVKDDVEGGGLEKRATVMFNGLTKFKPGYWIGVKYDEPLGKHDGSIQGERYFTCQSPYGAFVRPNLVTVGDYPEEDIFMSDEEEF